MKAVIIGGGIAGLSAAITLKNAGIDVVLKERASKFTDVGLGFIILPNGLEALDNIGAGETIRKKGLMLDKVIMRTPKGMVLKEDSLDKCIAIKRSDVINSLLEMLPETCIHNNSTFAHFEYDGNGNATHAVFENGTKESGDIFIATDGANSKIRKLLFPNHEINETKIKELVGIAEVPEIAKELKNNLLKTQSRLEGLSIGLLPCNDREVIWYMQYDSEKNDFDHTDNDAKKVFAQRMLKNWPEPIHTVLNNTDYSRAFVWFTKDMPVLASFHKKNIVLMGDAAHLVLPFTSQGVNSALQDALTISSLLKDATINQLEDKFNEYHLLRKGVLADYYYFGKMMAERFLDPRAYKNQEVAIPLAK